MYDSHFGYKQNVPKKTLGLLPSFSLLFFRFPDEVHNPRVGHFFRSPDEVHSFKGLRSVTSSGPQTRSRTSRHLVRPLLQVPRRGPELQATSFRHFVHNFKGPRSASFSTPGGFFLLAKFRQKAKFEIRNSKFEIEVIFGGFQSPVMREKNSNNVQIFIFDFQSVAKNIEG